MHKEKQMCTDMVTERPLSVVLAAVNQIQPPLRGKGEKALA